MKYILPFLLSTAMIFGLYRISPHAQQEREVVQLIQPQVSDIRDMIVLQGKVVDPSPIRLYAKGPSVVREIYVAPGQQVSAGEPLIQLCRTTSEQENQTVASSMLSQLRQAAETGDLAAIETWLEEANAEISDNEIRFNDWEVYELYSPVDCMVLETRVDIGEVINGVLPALVLCDRQNLLIEAEAEEDTIGSLQENMLCEITVPAFDETSLTGVLRTIMPYARQSTSLTGTSTAKTTLQITPDDTTNLRPGYRAEVRVITAYKTASLLIPYEAVLQDEDGQEFVLVLDENHVARRDVQTGSELDIQLEVASGLCEQDLLIAEPTLVQEGAYMEYDLVGTAAAGS